MTAERNRVKNFKLKIADCKLIFKEEGVTVRPITFCVMAERHGGEKPRFLPYGERSEASI